MGQYIRAGIATLFVWAAMGLLWVAYKCAHGNMICFEAWKNDII